MKVLMIIPELGVGGAQRSFVQLANDLASRYEVQIVVFNREYSIPYTLPANVHSLDVTAGRSFFDKALKLLTRVKRLKKLKQSIEPDVSISFLEGADYVNILSSLGEKVIISIRGSKVYDLEITGVLGWLRKRILIPWLYARASTVVTVSELLKSEIQKIIPRSAPKISVIQNYYDFDVLHQKMKDPLPLTFSNWLTGKVIVTVGRLHPGKNHRFLLDVFSELVKTLPEVKLCIIGDGPLRSELIDHSRKNGLITFNALENQFSNFFQVYFAGEQKNPFPFLVRSYLFVLPSLYEGFPNVLIEAMASGLPVVSADCNYGPREILAGNSPTQPDGLYEHGVLLPIEEHPTHTIRSTWIQAIKAALTSEEFRDTYIKRSQARANQYSRSNLVHKWFDLVES